MSLSEEAEVLRSVPLFSRLGLSKCKLLAFTSERLTFREGQTLFTQGDPGDAAYVIIDGTADVTLEAPGGPFQVARLGRNAIVGETAILCDVPRTATVTARSRLEALRISKDLFFRLTREFPEMAVDLLRELARRQARTNQQLTEAQRQLEAVAAGKR